MTSSILVLELVLVFLVVAVVLVSESREQEMLLKVTMAVTKVEEAAKVVTLSSARKVLYKERSHPAKTTVMLIVSIVW